MGEIWRKIGPYRWLIPPEFREGMRVPGLIYANESLLEHVKSENSYLQIVNVAFLPGIVKYSLAMPDIHQGYGFPIGGVAATDPRQGGVISPGGVGYDINCGVRLVRTDLRVEEVRGKLRELVHALFAHVPCGVGSQGKVRASGGEARRLLAEGAKWAVKKGYGIEEDVEFTEEGGCLREANPDKVGNRALTRGERQAGTLGAGNHFLEVQVVEEIYDENAARVMGLEKGQITVMIHSGSRGFGHQVCDDSLRVMGKAISRYGIEIPDRELASAPVESPEGRDYFQAMACAANYAWVNRQVLMHWTRVAFEKVFGRSFQDLGMYLVYDVAHNIAKFEEHQVEGKTLRLCVHRKGATRAFGPGHPELPERYRAIGQPVIIPGDMGTASYVLVGTELAMKETWGSTCHGAGRVMSRHKAIKAAQGRAIDRELEKEGIVVMARERRTLAEEAPQAYKDVNEVVEIVHQAGISRKVAKMRPLGVMKG